MSRKPPRKPARAPRTQPRDARGRFLSRRAIAALRGARTRARNQKAKAIATRKRVESAKHGERARKRTERALTPAQREQRRREYRRVTQKARRAKKAVESIASASRSIRSRSSRSSTASGRRSAGAAGSAAPKISATSPRTSPSKRPPATAGKNERAAVPSFAIGTGDDFSAQISVRFKMPRGFVPTRALVTEAIRYRLDNGEDAPHVRTRILRWRNPGRRHAEDRAWRQGNQADAWNTLANVIRASL